MFLFALIACSGEEVEEPVTAPTVQWLSPADGATIAAGTTAASVVVDDFTLESPAKHNEGAPIGYLAISIDGTEVLTTGETTFDLTMDPGAYTLEAALYFVDGDEVTALDGSLCEEDAEGCAPVAASVSITVE